MEYTAIFKLKKMLEEAGIPYLSFTDDLFSIRGSGLEFTPSYCLRLNENIDAVQHRFSYGSEEDLIEILGALTEEEQRLDQTVAGYLTAEEVFKRFKYCYEHKTTIYKEEN